VIHYMWIEGVHLQLIWHKILCWNGCHFLESKFSGQIKPIRRVGITSGVSCDRYLKIFFSLLNSIVFKIVALTRWLYFSLLVMTVVVQRFWDTLSGFPKLIVCLLELVSQSCFPSNYSKDVLSIAHPCPNDR
jgi:hypothetical protein